MCRQTHLIVFCVAFFSARGGLDRGLVFFLRRGKARSVICLSFIYHMRALRAKKGEVGDRESWGIYLDLPTRLKTMQRSFVEKGASI